MSDFAASVAALCAIDGCSRKRFRRDLCRTHYRRLQETGHRGGPIGKTTAQRFWPKVDKAGPLPPWAPFLGPCWLWTAGTSWGGYGKFSLGAREDGGAYAHRVAYELEVGPIPDGLVIDHLCRVRLCVRPDHLEPVTNRVNLLRAPRSVSAENHAKTHCVHGHPFDEANTHWSPDGRRVCRACKRETMRRLRAAS